MALERTYIMIKPNAVAERHVGDIIARIERTGLSIERMELAVLTEEQAEANYAEHVEKPFFRELVDFITSGPVVKMVVSGESASRRCARSWARRIPSTRHRAPFAATSASTLRRT